MSAVIEMVHRLQAHGIEFRTVGEKLRIGPPLALSPEDIELLREHKAEVIAYFQQQCLLSCAPCTCPPSLVCLKLFSDGCEKCGSVRCYLCLGCMRARRIALELNQPGQDMQSE
jgi:hypothetical protein